MHGIPLGTAWTADTEGGQHAALGQHVDGGALLGKQHRIAHRYSNDIDSELDPSRATCYRGQRGHAFQYRRAAHEAIVLPDRIDAALFAQIDPAPETGRGPERVFRQADTGGYGAWHDVTLWAT